MKFVLIMVLISSNGSGSVATAEFDDFQACETAGLFAATKVPPNWRLERICQAKRSDAKK